MFDVDSLDELTGKRLAVDNHCFGCTAGAGVELLGGDGVESVVRYVG